LNIINHRQLGVLSITATCQHHRYRLKAVPHNTREGEKNYHSIANPLIPNLQALPLIIENRGKEGT
jgi:hypothetical protein